MKPAVCCCFIALALAGCASTGLPEWALGEFADDYSSRYAISNQEWRHGQQARYHIVKVNGPGQYLIARNDQANLSDPLLFTRIDWMPLTGMAPYEWAFQCILAGPVLRWICTPFGRYAPSGHLF